MCEAESFDLVSDTTFFTFLREHYDEFEEFRARHGARAAYLKFHIFERRALPERALEEVEVDHCLLDVFVTDGKGRKARPWLTVLICRATKMILGIHVSFEVPSYATLSRAIIHAMSPKDLSAMPDVENEWPCHGVFDMLITDRGLEFLSESLARAGRDLRFAIVNLPGRMPHLKGTVERFFATLGVRVLTHLEGTTLSRTPQFYDPQARARYTLAEMTGLIVKWIVDDYHFAPHATLGKAPIERWRELVEDAEDGGVRPIRGFARLVMMMGERCRRKISNVGIHFDGHLYASYELAEMRRQRGGLKDKVEILADVTDRGHVWVLRRRGEDGRRSDWIRVPAVNQLIAKGLNKFAAKMVMRMARKIAGKGKVVTDEIMAQARAICDQQAATSNSRAALRYLSDAALATDVVGNGGILGVLAGAWMPPADTTEQDWARAKEAARLPSGSAEPKAEGGVAAAPAEDVASDEGRSDADSRSREPEAAVVGTSVAEGGADQPGSAKRASSLKELLASRAAARRTW